MMHRQAAPLALIAALALCTGAAGAQEVPQAPEGATADDIANNTAFGDWVVACEAVTLRRTVCRLVQELSLRESGQLLARFIAVAVEDGAILVAQVPMGVYLPAGAVYRFAGRDDLPQREMIWQRCMGEVCEAAAPIDDAEMAHFASVESILFGFRVDPEAEPVIVNVDVSRFAEAMALLAEVR